MENVQYEEISLRELIETLLKGKKIITGITIFALLISFVVSFFVLEPVYEAKTVLMASQVTDKIKPSEKPNGIEGILNSISEYPQMTIETYKQQIINPIILEDLIKELGLEEKEIDRNSLAKMITLETIKDTNLIAIKVKNTDKELATNIANTLANKFTEFISNMAKKQATKSSSYISSQLEIEKEKLDNALLEYKNFLSQPKGVKELEKEISSKLSLLTTYKTNLTTEKVNEQVLRAKLKKAEEELKNTPSKIELEKSLSDEPFMTQVVKDNTDLSNNELFETKIKVEEKNNNYYSLKSKISSYNISLAESLAKQENLLKEIENAQKDLEELQGALAEKQHKQRLILRKVNIAQSTYDSFTKKLEEARIAQSSTIADSSIIIVSPAAEPINPVSPNKTLNLAIAGILGLMISTFVVFFREYWNNSK